MKNNDWMVEEVLKILTEATLTPDQAGTSTRNGPYASAGANGPHPVDSQKFKGKLPDEEEKKHDTLQEKKADSPVQLKGDAPKMEPRNFPRLVPTEDWGKPDNDSREEIYKFFKTISGRTMEAKLKYINDVVDGKVQAKVKRILVTLVFLDSLSQVVKSFSASSAGFVFEAFLAALLQGTQLTDRTASGGLDLADIMGFQTKVDGQLKKGVPISLKLLVGGGKGTGKRGTGVHGSYANLIAAMARENFPEMVYVVALKDKSEQADKIDFWQFPITGENFSLIMKQSTTNNETVRIHRDILADPVFLAKVAKPNSNLHSELKAKFEKEEYLSTEDSYNLIDSAGWSQYGAQSDIFFHLLKYTKGYLANFDSPAKIGTAEKSEEDESAEQERMQETLMRLTEASKDTQFLVTQAAMKDTGKVGAKHIGSVGVSDAAIKKLVDTYADQLNAYLSSAYSNLANLSNNITSYFLAPDYTERVKFATGAIGTAGDAAVEGSEMKKRAKDTEMTDEK